MRRPSFFSRREPLEVKMTPMIDVVFLLLVFFIWTASFQIPEGALSGSIAAPAASSGESVETELTPADDFDQIVLRIEQQGDAVTWRLNDQEISDVRELRSRLAAIAAIRRDAPLILHPDSDVSLGVVIRAYDQARLAGFESIQFATPVELD